MSILDSLVRAVSGPAGQILEPQVRDIVDEVLRQQQSARPEDVDAVRSEIEQLKGDLHALSARISGLVEKVTALTEQAEKLQSGVAEALEAARKAAEAAPEEAGAGAAPAAAPKKAAARATPKKAAKKAAKADRPKGKPGRKSLAHLGCKVAGCKEPHRSRGFCGKHYQAWRRGSLPQFIMPDGTFSWKGRSFRVDRSLGGQTFKVTEEDGKAVVYVGKERTRVVPEEMGAAKAAEPAKKD